MVAGKVQKGSPPPLQMSGSDVNGPAYPPFRDRPQVHTRTPPAGGGEGLHRNTHPYIATCTAFSQRNVPIW
jgi:hypothetical protein